MANTTNTTDTFSTFRTNYNGLVSEFNSNVTTLTANVSSIKTNVAAIDTAVASINTSVVAINSNVSSLTTITTNLTNNVTAINTAVASTNTSITSINTAIAASNTSITALNSNVSSLTSNVTSLTANVASINTAVLSINTSITNLTSNMTQIRLEFDALVPTVANLTNGFINGTVNSPSIRFQDDPDTGFYRISEGVVGIATNGFQTVAVSNTSTIMRRNLALQNNSVLTISGNSANNDGGKVVLGYGNNISSSITGTSNGTWVMQVSNVSDLNISTQNTTGGVSDIISISPLGTSTFNFPIKHQTSNTYSQVYSAGSSVSDKKFYKDSVLRWSIGMDASSNQFINRHDSSGNYVDTPFAIASSNGALTTKGFTVWHSNNDGSGSGLDADLLDGFDSSAFAKLATATFTGNISSPKVSVDTNFNVQLVSTNPYINFDANDYISFDRTNNNLQYFVNNTNVITSNLAATSITAGATTYVANSTGLYSGSNVYWNSNNDGAGSGLDADLLDGQDSTYYTAIAARLGYTPLNKAGDTLTGQLVTAPTTTLSFANSTSNLAKLQVASANSTTSAFMQFSRVSGTSVYFGLDTDNNLKIGGWSLGNNAYRIWHEGNHGSASGLDADLLDGVQKDKLVKNLRIASRFTGGGTISVNASYGIAWTNRFLIISNGKLSSDAGYYDITMPANGVTINAVGGSTSQVVAGGVITLGAYESLYYIISDYTTNASNSSNFRLASYTTTSDIPENWILIATRNGDDNTIYFHNGIALKVSTSFDTTSNQSYAGNSLTLNSQSASYYTNIAARLGYTPSNKAGDTYTGTHVFPTLTVQSAANGVLLSQLANGQLDITTNRGSGSEKTSSFKANGDLTIAGGLYPSGDIIAGQTANNALLRAHTTGTGSKNSSLLLSTGTTGSTYQESIYDNTSNPYVQKTVGSAVTAVYNDAPITVFRTSAGVEISRFISAGQNLTGLLNITGSTSNSSANNIVIKNASNTDLFSVRNDGLITSYVDFLHKGNNLRQEASGGAFLYQRSTSATTDSKGFKIGPDNNGNLQAFFVNDADSTSTVFLSATRSGMTVTDISLTSTNINLYTNSLKLSNTSAGIELGSLSASGTPVIDFHSSGNNIDYDSRFIASGGSGVAGNGAVSYYGASFYVNSNLYLQKGAYFSAIDAAAGEGGELILQKSNVGTLAADIVLDVAGNNVRIFENTGGGRGATLDITTCASSAGSKIWHSNNDGAGSGLDADLLDGKDATYFIPDQSGKNGSLLTTDGTNTQWLQQPRTFAGGYVKYVTSSYVLQSGSYNVASVTRTGTGVYDVVFTTALPNTNYWINVTCIRTLALNSITYTNKTTTGFTINHAGYVGGAFTQGDADFNFECRGMV